MEDYWIRWRECPGISMALLMFQNFIRSVINYMYT